MNLQKRIERLEAIAAVRIGRKSNAMTELLARLDAIAKRNPMAEEISDPGEAENVKREVAELLRRKEARA